jgi:aspartate racemase
VIKIKTLGIIGGMGPYATLDFMKKVLHHTPAEKDWDHIHTIVDNNPHIPSRTRAVLYNDRNPTPDMVKSAKMLKHAGADLIVVPCNSAHYFLPDVQKQTDGIQFLNMIKLTQDYVDNLRLSPRGKKRIGIIGGYITVKKKIYEPFGDYNVMYLPEDMFKNSLDLIEKVKLNNKNYRREATTLIDYFFKQECQLVILACTELPIALGNPLLPNVIDAGDILAQEVVKVCTSP